MSLHSGRVELHPIYINKFKSCYLFIDRVVFGFEGSTHLIKCVVFGLGLNVSSCNQVGHEPDMRTRFASPKYTSCVLGGPFGCNKIWLLMKKCNRCVSIDISGD
jgi:hypothetical protein